MRLSIRMRVVLALNAFVICLAFAFGWIAQEVSGRIVEGRLTREMVSHVSDFMIRNEFPRSQLMMRYLSEMFNADWVVTEGEPVTIVASSLPHSQREEFLQESSRAGVSGVIRIGGNRYRMDSEAFSSPSSIEGQTGQSRFYILVPNAVFQEARSMAFSQVRSIMWPAAVIATLVAILLAISISRPLRQLAAEMDDIAEKESFEKDEGRRGRPEGPTEIAHLTSSFHQLMGRLAETRGELARNERLATLGKVCLSVAHELRNPLSGIKMNVRVLKDDLGPDSADDPGVEAILREIDRMELYLNELMNLSPDAHPQPKELERTNVRLSELAESVLGILSGRCRHARVEVTRHFPENEPFVSVDSNQIRQAMMNLIVNAIEVMGNGGTITLTIQSLPESVTFSVADTGGGVHFEQGDIFDAFVSGKPNGVGLGLYLCKQIVERHDGNLNFRNIENGAVFQFVLPREHTNGEGLTESHTPVRAST